MVSKRWRYLILQIEEFIYLQKIVIFELFQDQPLKYTKSIKIVYPL